MANVQRLFFIPEELSNKIDDWCKENDDTFSRFTRIALRAALDQKVRDATKSVNFLNEKPNIPLVTPPKSLPEASQPSEPDKNDPLPIYCDIRGCKSEIIGHYRVTTSGMDTKDMALCQFHLNIAKREAEVVELFI